jgi:UDP-3-O-[3-hydroxymyristoyl] glucosamine N-acyltransferase
MNALTQIGRNAPETLWLEPIRASLLAQVIGAAHIGPDLLVTGVGDLGQSSSSGDLVYVAQDEYARELPESGLIVVTTNLHKDLIPKGNSVLVDANPRGAWSYLFHVLRDQMRSTLEGVHPSSVIHSTARIEGPVRVSEDVVIGSGVTITGPVHIGKGVSIGPNSVVGGGGFEVAEFRGKRFLVPHLGGVWIEDDVEIRALTAVDSGFRVGFTVIGRGTKIDNLVHIAHGVVIGEDCTIVAGAEISGSTTIGNRVWIGPQSSVMNGITIGDDAMTGLGSSVRKNLSRNSVVAGAHLVVGYRCSCGVVWKLAEKPEFCSCSRLIRDNQ